MIRLIVNPGTESAWEIPLSKQTLLLGRGGHNDFPVEHPSVSDTHCRITVMQSGVLVKDEGSINGTFIDGKMIEESLLLPGQTLRLGDVSMQLEADSPAAIAPPLAGPAPVAAPAVPFCKSHPKAIGRFYCPACDAYYCDLCVHTRMAGGRPGKFCYVCESECSWQQAEPANDTPPFSRLIGGAFTYPFKHDGLILLIAGTVVYTVADFLAGFLFFIGLVVMVIGAGYLFNYLQRILTASARGDDRMPDWPDFSDWSDISEPFLQTLGAVLFSFGPVILINLLAPDDAAWKPAAFVGTLFWGCLSFPMNFTAVTMFDSLGALNPLLTISSMLKIPGAYLLSVCLLLFIVAINRLGNTVLAVALPVPFLPGLISEFIGLYLMTVEMRILGLMYWTKKSELGWFRH